MQDPKWTLYGMLNGDIRNGGIVNLPMQRIVLTRYPACTKPAIPVLAAAMKPPPNTTAGIA
jgi:hypothetical protein